MGLTGPAVDGELLASVVVCTKDRGDRIVGTLASILANDYAPYEVIVIDQSIDDATERAVAPFLADERVHYEHSSTVGVSRSRNAGLLAARSEYVLMTDDDCEVDPNWIRASMDALRSRADVAIVFGNVVAPAGVSGGVIPESVTDEDFVVRRMRQMRFLDGACCGIGASMAVRRSIALGVGGFDEELGPGGPLKTAEDTDLTLRVLLAGNAVAHLTSISVDHYGARTPDEFRVLVRSTMFGLGAVCGKLLRLRRRQMLFFTAGVFVHLIAVPIVTNLVRLRLPPVAGRIAHFARGLRTGWRLPVQRASALFTPGAALRERGVE